MQEPITKEGYDLLTKEFKFLLEVEKPKAAHEKLVAAALGDRSENADYQAAKEKLRHIDKRLFYLNSVLQKAQIIDPSLSLHERVSFGSSVRLLDINCDEEVVYTICGITEAEPHNNLISVHAPLARAMIGKRANEEFTLFLPSGKKEYEIVEIFYVNIFSLKKNIRSEADFSFH
ncbi:MAG: transcription elongation factor GreA [Campylobacterota bacterium]|nr:transcription elongation factor GreA [Campylobacterota bacterium]